MDKARREQIQRLQSRDRSRTHVYNMTDVRRPRRRHALADFVSADQVRQGVPMIPRSGELIESARSSDIRCIFQRLPHEKGLRD